MSHLPFRNFVHLSQPEACALMRRILSGEMDTAEIASILQFLRRKGETITEIVGFAVAMRELAQPLELDQSTDPILDTCGTGGDGTNTFNISTVTAFVVAGAGQQVAKHGNRRISSKCGSADVLEAAGVAVDLTAQQVASCIRETGIGFLFAPVVHPAVKHSQDARLQIKGRTVFNLLGPLTNPVGARLQLIGAFSIRAAELLAQASARLGTERAFVVHGADGLDEISTTGQTTVFQVEAGAVQKGQWSPQDFGVSAVSIEDLAGGEPAENADILRAILEGEAGPRRDIVIANAAAALLLTHKADDLKSAVALAHESIDSGSAKNKLEQLITVSSRLKSQSEQQPAQT